jgi:DNA topoisomerase I
VTAVARRNGRQPAAFSPVLMRGAPSDLPASADPPAAADAAGLIYVTDDTPGISRRRVGAGFRYLDASGARIADAAVRARIRALAVPPAWTEVWICTSARGHLQATGRDARGRKQYRYHDEFRTVRDSAKFDRLLAFAAQLPRIRATTTEQMAQPGLSREKVLATIVQLLDRTMIRIGNADYARQNKSYGLTTLRDRHVQVNGSELRFSFTGKGGKAWQLKLHDRRLAKVVKAAQELPGQDLFQYLDEQQQRRNVTSSDVNDYLRDITGQDITAKDFRTWAGTVLAALALHQIGAGATQTAAKRNLREAINRVAGHLGNTAAICRKCYVHPVVAERYLGGALRLRLNAKADIAEQMARGLSQPEQAVLRLLRRHGAEPA